MSEHTGPLDSEIFAHVAEALRPLGLDRPALREVMRDLVAVGFVTETAPPPPDHRGVHPGRLGDDKWYAVHTKDLTTLGGITTAILAGLVGAGLAPATVVAGVGSLAVFLWAQRREQVALDPLDGLVLHTLNRQPGHRATAEALAALVGLSVEATQASLERIKTLRRNNQTEGKLVEALPDGTWLAVDLKY